MEYYRIRTDENLVVQQMYAPLWDSQCREPDPQTKVLPVNDFRYDFLFRRFIF